jgi:hypothetical protein
MAQTLPRMDTATAMLIGIDDRIARSCITILDDAGFRVVRVKHVAPACERIPVVMPQIVLLPSTLRNDEHEMIVDRCTAIGAELYRIGPDVDDGALTALLVSAVQTAMTKVPKGAH